MQESILEIGNIIYSPSKFIDDLIKRVDVKDKKGNNFYVVQLDFDTRNKKIELIESQIDDETAKELVYVGSADGSSSPQWYTTAASLEYLITQTIPNLIEMEIEGISDRLKDILQEFFWDLGEQKGQQKRYRYLLNLKKISPKLPDKEELLNELAGGKLKDLGKNAKKHIDNYLKEERDINSKSIKLYYITIDGERLSDKKEYIDRIVEEKSNVKIVEKGICYGCGSRDELTDDTTKLKIKFYTTNQWNFPSNFKPENYSKNMLLCKTCYTKLQVGEQFVFKNFDTRLAAFKVFVIPHILFPANLKEEDLKLFADKTNKTFNVAKRVEKLKEIEEEIQKFLEYEEIENYFLFNIIFYKTSQSSTKVLKFIKDVAPSRFNKIIKAFDDVKGRFKNILPEYNLSSFGLESVYWLTPVKIDNKGEVTEFRKILKIYDSFFTGNKLAKRMIIETQIKLFKILYYEQFKTFNIKEGNLDFDVIRSNMYLRVLQNLGIIEEGEGLDTTNLNLSEEIKGYLEEMAMDSQEAAMFLLGYLIGKVANKQYLERNKRKPILNKLNYNGMDQGKVLRLSNEIIDKLRQNKVLNYETERVFAVHRQLLDKEIKNWKLNKMENLYYILSGYSFSTLKVMGNKKEINDEGGISDEE
ncbi:TIGR02556 family CRISPR-associated protein [Anaerobranca gottschalkii]|uniref:CRISPR-associated protein Csh1 n=1 Tax=Anaerobranca gottschalkii DSM 13577 TaxID=1120990 RepID=A0A1I0A906_9FIRM|nr:TIGR02556 family CRISPR-associated protein [Anaerobranca gottschalkii]SES90649.1 CRISPR-associated protein Csh1 [Anaerobranca gottschalkii DSM 13577]